MANMPIILFVDTVAYEATKTPRVGNPHDRDKWTTYDSLLRLGPLSALGLRFPPARRYSLVLLQLATLARDAGCDPKYLNASLTDLVGFADVPYEPSAVIFSDTTPSIPRVLDLCSKAKRRWPGAWTVVGGHHSTAKPASVLGAPQVDVVVSGEGEVAFRGILCAILSNTKVENIAVNGCLTQATRALASRPRLTDELDSLDAAPSPAYDLLPGGLASFSAYLMTSRGCPFGCPYCVMGLRPRTPRVLTPERTWAELLTISELTRKTYDVVHIADDNITVGNDRLSLMLRQKPLGYTPALSAELRLEYFSRKSLEDLRDLGLVQLNVGIESLDASVQQGIGKRWPLQEIVKRLALAKSIFGGALFIKAYFMMGLPGETRDSAERTTRGILELLREGVLDFASVQMFKPLPGTAMFERPGDFGVSLSFGSWGDFDRLSSPAVHGLVGMSADEIYGAYCATEKRLRSYREPSP